MIYVSTLVFILTFSLFVHRSKKILCPYCEHRGVSIIEERNMLLSYLAVLAFFVILGWVCGALLAPIILGLLR
jgi:LITAF-like zinc ribbon domain